MSASAHHSASESSRFSHHPLLGTLVEVRVAGCDDRTAQEVDRVVVDEIARLERVLSIHDPTSELERWKSGDVTAPSPDLAACLIEALDWHRRSDGAFSTAVGFVTAIWKEAERRGAPPTAPERRAAAARAATPAYEVGDDGVPRIVGDASAVDLNALAKGWIVDRAVDAVTADHPGVDVVVSAGGDLRHCGDRPTRIGIENPLRPYDNEPPITTIELRGAAIASSGRARRGYGIAGRWYAHVVDPRTGDTVDGIASISVVAPFAATADVMATIAGVMPPEKAVEWCQARGSACLVITTDGSRLANDAWRAIEVK